MNSLANSDYGLILNMLSVFVLGWEVSCVYLWFIVEIANDLDGVIDIEDLIIVFICWDYYPLISFCCFYQLVFFQA